VVNNSSKIEVVDLTDFTSIATISGLNSPRYILPISNTKAYVSDLYEDKIYILNPESLSLVGTIDSKGWTEEMVLVDGKAFVCQIDSSQVLVIDTQKDSIIEKINTNKSPSSIGADQDGTIWVACTGGIQESYPAIHKINSMNFQVEQTMELQDVNKSIQHLSFGPNGRSIYYIMGDVFHMELGDSTLSSTPLIPANGRNFYGLGIDSFNEDIYVSDALDYQQKGVVYRYNKEGLEVANFKAGLIPANFFFN
jgi:DNA-binding beta-propeller fold protein YncE